MPDPNVQQVQSYLIAKRPMGVGYPLAPDGEVTPELISVLNFLQSGLSNRAGHPVSLISGNKVNSGAIAAMEKALGREPAAQPAVPKTEELAKTETSEIEKEVAEEPAENKKWESFLNQSLPVVGKLYDGDVASSAKKLEAAISKEIGKPVAGIIWSDAKKQFNTTPDDILAALQKIEMHKKTPAKSANLSRDDRYLKIATMLREYDLQKNAK